MDRKENQFKLPAERDGPVAREDEVARMNHRIIEPSPSISMTPEYNGDRTGETHEGTAEDFF